MRSSDLRPIIKQGDYYTFQQQTIVYNNLPKDFSKIKILKLFQRKRSNFIRTRLLPES